MQPWCQVAGIKINRCIKAGGIENHLATVTEAGIGIKMELTEITSSSSEEGAGVGVGFGVGEGTGNAATALELFLSFILRGRVSFGGSSGICFTRPD